MLIGNFAKVNNLCAFRLKKVPVRLYSSTNNDSSKILEDNIVNENNESSNNYENDIKSKILQSSLPYVPQHGWSRDTIAAGINF